MMFFFLVDPTFGSLAPLERGLAQIRAQYPQMTVGALETLIHVARAQQRIAADELSVTDLANEMAAPYPTVARHTDILGSGIAGRGGLHFVKKVASKADQKQRRVVLTAAGKDFLHQFMVAMNAAALASPSRTGP